MDETRLFQDNDGLEVRAAKRPGPPNRMNDLPYRDWMKFQKSFFWYTSSQSLVEECVRFFTKAVWPDGQSSRSLIVGVEDFDAEAIPAPREVESFGGLGSLEELVHAVLDVRRAARLYDFALVDLRPYIKDRREQASFLTDHSGDFFSALRQLLVPQRYCGVLVGTEGGGDGFPLPWSVALASRDALRLRDEKVGLVKDEDEIFYCLFMQAQNDERPASLLSAKDIGLAADAPKIPAWLIPKPPPRKPNEILHPAKFPETLIAEFIELFTEPGDNVLDPMAGTGSTVVAAAQMDRNGYGVELSPEYAAIARRRIDDQSVPQLFDELAPQPKTLVAQGDATKLDQIVELKGLRFHYAITSPPYWSMLANPGSENQRARRERNLSLTYSEDASDLGNVHEYAEFLNLLEVVYGQVAAKLVDGGHLTVIVKNVKRHHVLYTLAWDLVARLCAEDGKYDYGGTTLWCQDDIGLKPFAVGIHWVSNILHQYCLHFRKRG